MLFVIVNISVLMACSLSRYVLPPTPIGKGYNTATPFPTFTMQPSQAATVSPTVRAPVCAGTALPQSLPAISPQNVSKLSLLAQYGEGIGMAMAFSPDGTLLVVATTRGLVFYDGKTLEPVRTISTTHAQRALAISSDGEWLASGGEDGSIHLWKLPDGILQAVLNGHKQPVFSLAFSPNGQWLASGGWDRMLNIWYAPQADLVRTLDSALAAVQAVRFSADGSRLYAWNAKEPLTVWNFIDNRQLDDIFIGLDNRNRTGSSAAFSVDGTLFAVDQDSRVRLMNTDDGTTRAQLMDFQQAVLNVALSADGELAATLQADSIKVWTTQPAAMVFDLPLDDKTGDMDRILFDPQAERLLALGDRLVVWDLTETDPQPKILAGSYSSAFRIADRFTEDGKTIVSLSHDSGLGQVDLQSGEVLVKKGVLDVDADLMALSTGGVFVAASHIDGDVVVYDGGDGTVAGQLKGSRRSFSSLAISPDGQQIALGTFTPTMQLWDAGFETLLAELSLDDIPNDLHFSPDGQLLAIKQGNAYRIYSVNDDAIVGYITGHAIAFSPDGYSVALLAVKQSDPVLKVSTLDGDEANPLYEELCSAGDLVFSPTGDLLALSGTELTVRDAASGEVLVRLDNPAPQGEVSFSPDGSLLMVSASDGVVYLYGIR